MRTERCYECGFPRRDNAEECRNCKRRWDTPPTDEEFWSRILGDAHWLFYGDLDDHFAAFVARVFEHDLSEWGFRRVPMEPEFAVAYWLFVSELVALDLADYGTSPRGAWLTDDGKRFKRIFLERNAANTLDWSQPL